MGGYIYQIIINPLQEVLGAPGYEFKDFKDVDADGKNLKGLKEDLIGRIGIGATFILRAHIYWCFKWTVDHDDRDLTF